MSRTVDRDYEAGTFPSAVVGANFGASHSLREIAEELLLARRGAAEARLCNYRSALQSFDELAVHMEVIRPLIADTLSSAVADANFSASHTLRVIGADLVQASHGPLDTRGSSYQSAIRSFDELAARMEIIRRHLAKLESQTLDDKKDTAQ